MSAKQVDVKMRPHSQALEISAFPKEVQGLLAEVDDEGNGLLEMDELTQVFKEFKTAREQKQKGVLFLDSLPPNMRTACEVFDTDGSGTIHATEVVHAAQLYEKSKQEARRYARIAAFLLLFTLLLLGAMMSLTFVTLELSKESKVGSDGTMTVAGSDQIVKVKSADTSIDDSSAQLVSKGGKEVTMPKRATEIGLNFHLPLEFYNRLEMVRVDEPTFQSIAAVTGVSKTSNQLIIRTDVFKIRVFKEGNTLVQPLDEDLSGSDIVPLQLGNSSDFGEFEEPTARHLLSTGRALLSTGGVNVKVADEVAKENEVAEGEEANVIKVRNDWKCERTRTLEENGQAITNFGRCKMRVMSPDVTRPRDDEDDPFPCTEPLLFGFKRQMDEEDEVLSDETEGSDCWCLTAQECSGSATYTRDWKYNREGRAGRELHETGSPGYIMFYLDRPLLNRQVTAVNEAATQLGATDKTPIPDDARIKLVARGAMCMNVKKLFLNLPEGTPVMEQMDILEDTDNYPFMTVDQCMQLALNDRDCLAHGPTIQFHDYGIYKPKLYSQHMDQKEMAMYHCSCSYQCAYDRVTAEKATNINTYNKLWNQLTYGNPRCSGVVLGINGADAMKATPGLRAWRDPMPQLAGGLKLVTSYDTLYDIFDKEEKEYEVYESPRYQSAYPYRTYKKDEMCTENCEMLSQGIKPQPVPMGHCLDPKFQYTWTEEDFKRTDYGATTNIFTWDTGEGRSCSMINIGNSITPENKFEVPPGQVCPSVINEENGVDSVDAGLVLHAPTYTEEVFDGSSVKIKNFVSVFVAKSNQGAGQTSWDQNIEFQCCTPDPADFAYDGSAYDADLIITVGTHPAGGWKTVNIPDGIVCPSRVNKQNWIGPYDNDVEYIVTQEGGRENPRIRVTRPHNHASCPVGAGSWTDQYLQIKCERGIVYEPKKEPDPCTYVEIGAASSSSRPLWGVNATWEGVLFSPGDIASPAIRKTHCFMDSIEFTHHQWKKSLFNQFNQKQTPTDDNNPASRDNGNWKDHKFRMRVVPEMLDRDWYQVERIDAEALAHPGLPPNYMDKETRSYAWRDPSLAENQDTRTAEERSAKLWNYAFRAPCCPDGDQEGSIVIDIGPGDSWLQGSKRVGVPEGFMCPHTISRDNWVDTATYGDVFHVTQEGNEITRVARVDAPGQSWGIELKIRCHRNRRCMNVVIGSAAGGDGLDQYGMTTPVTVPQDYICPVTVDQHNWYGGWKSGEEFTVSRDGDQLSVARTGCNIENPREYGWYLDLGFQCCMAELYEEADQFGCPASMTATVPNSAPALCSHLGGATITYTGQRCGNGRILWTSMETHDASGNPVYAGNGERCAWNAEGKDTAWRDMYTGSCAVAPAVAGIAGLPTFCSQL